MLTRMPIAAPKILWLIIALALAACVGPANSVAQSHSAARITYPDPSTLDARQREIYDATVAGQTATLGPGLARMGPRLLILHDATLADAWGAMGSALRNSGLPPRYKELATLVVAREWTSQFEWYAHERGAQQAGLSVDVIESIRADRRPVFANENDAVIYDYTLQLMRDHDVDDATYQAAWRLLGTKGLVDLTVYIGHYVNVAITLNAHRAPLPEGVAPPLPRLHR